MQEKQNSRPNSKPKAARRFFGTANALFLGQAAKHRQHVKVLAVLVLVFGLAAGVWLGWEYLRIQQLQSAQHVVDSKFEGIQIESNTYNSAQLHGYASYVVTESPAINEMVRGVVDNYFLPCKNTGLQNTSGVAYECNASFTIDFATPEYLQVTYTFRENHGASKVSARKVGLLFDRKTGARLNLADLFKPDSSFEPLARLSREALQAYFGERYKKDERIKEAVLRVTEPDAAHFENFILAGDEKLTLIYNNLALFSDKGDAVAVQLPIGQLYGAFNAKTVETFFPKLKEQKEAERKVAEEAKRQAEAAEAARRKIRQQVAPNRSNINCAVMKCIALTFDDGPHALTGPLLDILKARKAVATFFVLGSQVAGGTAVLQRAASEQHEIANHTWSHANLTYLSDAGIAWEIQQTDQAIFNATGAYPKVMRPSYGAWDARVAAQAAMPIVMWSVDTYDWRDRNAELIYQRAIAGAHPGAIILMHELHMPSLQAAARLIDELQRQGYILATVSELLGITEDNFRSLTGTVFRQR